MPFEIIDGDILRQNEPVEAIAVSAGFILCDFPAHMSKITKKVYEAAGYDKVAAALEGHGETNAGEVVVTPGFGLGVKYIIHAYVPLGSPRMKLQSIGAELRKCYRSVLSSADKAGINSISIALLKPFTYSLPVYADLGEFPEEVAFEAIREWLCENESSMNVHLFVPKGYEPVRRTQEEVHKPMPDFGVGSRYFEFAERMKKVSAESKLNIDDFYRERVGFYFSRPAVPGDSAIAKCIDCSRDLIFKLRKGIQAATHHHFAVAIAIAMGLTDDYERFEFINCASMTHRFPADDRDRLVEELFARGITNFDAINEEVRKKMGVDRSLNASVKKEKQTPQKIR